MVINPCCMMLLKIKNNKHLGPQTPATLQGATAAAVCLKILCPLKFKTKLEEITSAHYESTWLVNKTKSSTCLKTPVKPYSYFVLHHQAMQLFIFLSLLKRVNPYTSMQYICRQFITSVWWWQQLSMLWILSSASTWRPSLPVWLLICATYSFATQVSSLWVNLRKRNRAPANTVKKRSESIQWILVRVCW